MNSASQLNEYCMKNGMSVDRYFSYLPEDAVWYCVVRVGQYQMTAQNSTKKKAFEDACGKVLLELMETPIADAISIHGGESLTLGHHQRSVNDLVSRLERIEKKLDILMNKTNSN